MTTLGFSSRQFLRLVSPKGTEEVSPSKERVRSASVEPEKVTKMQQVRLCSVKLSDGNLMPVLGFGTSAPSQVPKSMVKTAVENAISVGYRHIDSAYLYANEEEVGRAIRKKISDGTVRREDVFYTSKLWATFHRPELVRMALEHSLRKTQLSYLDLYLMHFPVALEPGEDLVPTDAQGQVLHDTVDICATWEALEKCKDAGLVRSLGVSNFNHRQLDSILTKPGLKYPPVCNQVECHLYLNQHKLLDFCKARDIVLVAYAALGSDPEKPWVTKNYPLLKDPVLNALADKLGHSPAQVALRYQLQRGVVTLVKSFTQKRILENFQVFDFELSPEDMRVLDDLNRGLRYFKYLEFAQHPNYPFIDDY